MCPNYWSSAYTPNRGSYGQQNPFVVNFRKDVTGSRWSACWKLRGCVTQEWHLQPGRPLACWLGGKGDDSKCSAGRCKKHCFVLLRLNKNNAINAFLGSVFVFSLFHGPENSVEWQSAAWMCPEVPRWAWGLGVRAQGCVLSAGT